jgi:hypothetical protein
MEYIFAQARVCKFSMPLILLNLGCLYVCKGIFLKHIRGSRKNSNILLI